MPLIVHLSNYKPLDTIYCAWIYNGHDHLATFSDLKTKERDLIVAAQLTVIDAPRPRAVEESLNHRLQDWSAGEPAKLQTYVCAHRIFSIPQFPGEVCSDEAQGALAHTQVKPRPFAYHQGEM